MTAASTAAGRARGAAAGRRRRAAGAAVPAWALFALVWLAATGDVASAAAAAAAGAARTPVDHSDPRGGTVGSVHGPYGTSRYDDAIPVYGEKQTKANDAYGPFPYPEADGGVRSQPTASLLRLAPLEGGADGKQHFMVPAEMVDAAERPPAPGAVDAGLVEPNAGAALVEEAADRRDGKKGGINPLGALAIGAAVVGGGLLLKHTGIGAKIGAKIKTFFSPKETADVAAKALGFDPSKLPPRSAPLPGRKLDPNFDKLDMPEKCPSRCNGNGKCLIDKTRLVQQGNVEAYPYKCVCSPEYTGVACQTRVDQYIRWFESNGTTSFPRCCPTCPSQFRAPTNYDDLPTYQNPYSVSNCDPQLSVDSRPDASGRPPCWRPLSAVGIATPGDQAAAAAAASLIEQGAYAERGDVDPAVLAAAKAEERRRLQERVAQPVAECCVFCDFDFWAEVNSRPASPRPGRGNDYLRALERQRVLEQFGGQAVIRELRRRERVRAEALAQPADSPFAAPGFVELGGVTDEEQRASDAARASRRSERESARRRGAGEQATDPQNPGASRGECCSVCPVAARDPFGVDMKKYEEERKAALDETNNRFGSFLRRARKRPSPGCCNSCPSQFFIRTVSKDTDPFYGKEKIPPPAVTPGTFGESSEPAEGDAGAAATE